mgnify:CR=1 FL=1
MTYISKTNGKLTVGNTFHDSSRGQRIVLRLPRGVEVEFEVPEHSRNAPRGDLIIQHTKDLKLQFYSDSQALDALQALAIVVNEALRQVKHRLGEQTQDLEEWEKAVIARDKQCVRCGATERLNACHIEPKNVAPELQFYVGNGVTFCDYCLREWRKECGDTGGRKGYLCWWLYTTAPKQRNESGELDDWIENSGIF